MVEVGFFRTMTTTLSVTADLKLEWEYTNLVDISTVVDDTIYREKQEFADGTSDEQVNRMFRDRVTLSPASPTADYDLAGVLVDVFGQTLTFTKIRVIAVVNKGEPNTGHTAWTPVTGTNVVVGDAASNPFSTLFDDDADGKIKIPSGGMFAITAPYDGWAVTAGTGDILRLALESASADADVDLIVIVVG